MNQQHSQPLAQVIGAIGHAHFVEAASRSLCQMAGFQLSSVVLHHRRSRPELMFDDLRSVGYETGMENYLRVTHCANPMLAEEGAEGAFRASDFRSSEPCHRAELADVLIPAPDEELGFRTIGWPERLEEVGMYFRACGGIIELSLYRERGRRAASAQTMRALNGMRVPLAAAFERHAQIERTPRSGAFSVLTDREREVAELLLAGCSSEAIALRLAIARYTVKDHRKGIFRKLHIGSLAELFARAHPRA